MNHYHLYIKITIIFIHVLSLYLYGWFWKYIGVWLCYVIIYKDGGIIKIGGEVACQPRNDYQQLQGPLQNRQKYVSGARGLRHRIRGHHEDIQNVEIGPK